MDQDAFRSLLSQPREASSSRGKAVLGKAAPKRGWGLKPKAGHDYSKKDEAEGSKPAFAPRTQKKKAREGAGNDESAYKDRAALRRAGGDGEYKDVEKLLQDFEKRKEEAGDDAGEVEAQRAYLGGDAEHSVLVKGLDFALLARRKAELEAEKADNMEDELDQLGDELVGKVSSKAEAPKADKPKVNKFKSLAQKKADAEAAAAAAAKAGASSEKPKKKKKIRAAGAGSVPAESVPLPERSVEPERGRTPPRQAPAAPIAPVVPPEEDDDEDIFADAGEYDLKAYQKEDDDEDDVDDSEEEKEEGEMDVDERRSYSRSRSGSLSRGRDRHASRSRSRSWSRSRTRSRSRSRSRSYDRYDRRDSRSYDRGDRRYRERSYTPERDIYRHHSPRRSRERSYNRDFDHDRYDRNPTRNQYDRQGRNYNDRHNLEYRTASDSRYRDQIPRRSRSSSHDRDYNRHEHRNRPVSQRRRSRSPIRETQRERLRQRDHRERKYESRTPSRSPSRSPPRKRQRSRTRSLTPILHQVLPISRSPSPESDEEGGPVTKLQPLSGSVITDLKGFLAADEAGAKEDARRLNKAKWRAAQGLAVQEGVDAEMLKGGPNEKQKANRDFQILMNKMDKKEKEEKKE